jgi:hypothetical protein
MSNSYPGPVLTRGAKRNMRRSRIRAIAPKLAPVIVPKKAVISMDNKPRLEQWTIRQIYEECRNFTVYCAPEQIFGRPYLIAAGKIYNHPSFEDGVLVSTSEILEKNEECVATVNGSIYLLGEKHSSSTV